MGTVQVIPSADDARARYAVEVNSFSTRSITNWDCAASYLTSMEAWPSRLVAWLAEGAHATGSVDGSM